MDELSRRDLIKLGAAATLTVSLGGTESLAQAPRFFTPEELALVDELSDIIIPSDDHSPGARAAKVAAYIDTRLAEAWDATEKTTWREGLKVVEQVSRETSGKAFLQSAPAERIAVVTRMARNEAKPQNPEEVFFLQLKARVVDAYYTSEIGIKQEMEYKGNSYLPEFVGFDVREG
ncbi:MAG: gluconate 2-dehydrogenase subunit 3 family protein [Vicinamibacterales bacterium]